MRTPTLILSAALLVLSTSGCVAAAAGAAAVIVSQDVLDNNVYVARLDRPADLVWASSKVALSHLSPKPYEVQDDIRQATADVDDAKVTVTVDTYDLNRSTLRVSARKYGVNNGEIAKMVYDKILQELDK
jgi:hypothetical protein